MGTGKTSIGRQLAKIKRWRFVDLDDRIEEKEKRGIPDIFAKDGETYFRKIEKQVLKEISLGEDLVIACGGGIVIQKENIELMKATGKIICLTSSAEAILKRTSRFINRPLLNVADPKAKIESLLKERAEYYALADITVDTSSLTVKEAAEKLSELIPVS